MSNKVLQFPIADLVTPTTCNRNPLCLLDDIDHYEHSILMYLASTHPSDDIVNAAVERSVNQISLMTKISKSTVRVRLRSLVHKGYLEREHQFVSTATQSKRQLANRYIFTKKIVEIVEEALSECMTASEEKLAVGQSHSNSSSKARKQAVSSPVTYESFAKISESACEPICESSAALHCEPSAEVVCETPATDIGNTVADALQNLSEPMKPLSLSLTPAKIPGLEAKPIPSDRKPPASAGEIIRRCEKLLELYPANELLQSRITTLIQTAQIAKFHVALSIYNRYDHLYEE